MAEQASADEVSAMDEHADTDDLRLDALTASAGACHIGIAVRGAQGLHPDTYVNLTPDQALRLGEWLVERAGERGAARRTIDNDRIEF
jgi:hypothetical protein